MKWKFRYEYENKIEQIKRPKEFTGSKSKQSVQNHSTYKEPEQSVSLSFLHMLKIWKIHPPSRHGLVYYFLILERDFMGTKIITKRHGCNCKQSEYWKSSKLCYAGNHSEESVMHKGKILLQGMLQAHATMEQMKSIAISLYCFTKYLSDTTEAWQMPSPILLTHFCSIHITW